jgi:hypothetical protein
MPTRGLWSLLLEWLRSDVASWRGGSDGLFLECGGLDCCVFAEDGEGFSRLKGGVALASDPALKSHRVLCRARSRLTGLLAIAAR